MLKWRVPCHSSLLWPPGAVTSDPRLHDALGPSRPAAQPLRAQWDGCGAAVPGGSRPSHAVPLERCLLR